MDERVSYYQQKYTEYLANKAPRSQSRDEKNAKKSRKQNSSKERLF